MEFSVKHNSPEKARGACQIITVAEPRKLSASGKLVDKACNGSLTSILKTGDMNGAIGQTLMLHGVEGSACARILLLGVGKDGERDERGYARIVGSVTRALADTGARDAEFYPGDISLKGRDLAWKARQAALLAGNSEYRFDRLKSGRKEAKRASGGST